MFHDEYWVQCQHLMILWSILIITNISLTISVARVERGDLRVSDQQAKLKRNQFTVILNRKKEQIFTLKKLEPRLCLRRDFDNQLSELQRVTFISINELIKIICFCSTRKPEKIFTFRYCNLSSIIRNVHHIVNISYLSTRRLIFMLQCNKSMTQRSDIT